MKNFLLTVHAVLVLKSRNVPLILQEERWNAIIDVLVGRWLVVLKIQQVLSDYSHRKMFTSRSS